MNEEQGLKCKVIMDDEIIITKLDAAQRQLDTAIFLYFQYGEPVSIHTLTSAGYNIIRDLCKKLDLSHLFIKDLLLKYIKEDKREEFRRLINKAENYFKHADRDHKEFLKFNPHQTELLIYDACLKCQSITK